jgi:glucose dehydrogenase
LEIRRAAFAGTLVGLWVVAVVAGCQRQETPEPTVVETETQPEMTGPAWVDANRIRNADAEPQNWLAHGRTWSEQRYSPLTDINESNIGELGLAWYFDLDTARGQQASPIVVDGVMYTTSAWSKVQVLDAATGELLSAENFMPTNWATHIDLKTGRPVEVQGRATTTLAPP